MDPATWTPRAQVVGAIATTLGVLVALFQGSFWLWWRRPILHLVVDEPPHKTTFTSGHITICDCYFTRVAVSNVGKSTAEKVEVLAGRLFKRDESGEFHRIRDFPSINLKWSHILGTELSIAPGMQKPCDLGFLASYRLGATFVGNELLTADENARQRLQVDPSLKLFAFELQVRPNHARHILPPGEYCIELTIGGTNAALIRRGVRIKFTGEWFDSENEMIERRGLSIQECTDA